MSEQSSIPPTKILVPNIGDFEDVTIIEVLVTAGDTVEVGSPLVTLESEKATVEIPSPFAGVVESVMVKVGDKVSEDSPIALLCAGNPTQSNKAAQPAPQVQAAPQALLIRVLEASLAEAALQASPITPTSRLGSWLARLGSWLAVGVSAVVLIGVGLVVLTWGVYALIDLLPILVFLTFYFGLGCLFLLEASPYPSSRFAIALVSGLLADRIVFWFAASEHLYRSAFTPTVYALSIVCGYTVWRLLSPAILQSDANIEALPGFAGFLVTFPMLSVSVFVLSHFFPWFHSYASWVGKLLIGD